MTPCTRETRIFAIASLLFFSSGGLGLGYELVWIRKAALIVGASQIALSTVLTALFLGIALGSYFFGRHLRGRWSPLLVYGVLEIGIGLFALAFPTLFDVLEWVYAFGYPLASGTAVTLFGLRFVLLFLLFLPPTFLMGGTLPLLLDGLVARDRAIGPRTSFLYGVNILGAVFGVLITAYFGIPLLGVNGCSLAGGLANLAIGGIALLAFSGQRPAHEDYDDPPLERFYPAAAFGAGLLAIGYQISWARYFGLFQFSTVYRTAVLLAVYLLALALGSFVLAPMLRARWRPLVIVGFVQALIPLVAMATLSAWRLAEYRLVMLEVATATGGTRPAATFELAHDDPRVWHFFNETADAIFFAPLVQIALVLFVPVLLMGTTLPALIAAATRRSADLRSVSGRLVFWNTLVSSSGGFAAGYALLPLLGLHWTFFVLGSGSLALSLVVSLRREETERPSASSWLRLAAPAIGVIALGAICFTRPDITRSTLERYLTADRDAPEFRIKTVREGPLTTAYVTEESGALRLGSGSVQMGHVVPDKVSGQALAGHMPVVWYPGEGMPRRCLGLCLGSGQSFGALLRYPIESLDVVEISSEITELALSELREYNNDLANDERVTMHLDDARHFVERAPDNAYDLISMESPPPTSDGVYSLYSMEFFSQVRRALREDGVFMHFLPLYFLTPLDAQAVIDTMTEVFPHTFLVKITLGDYVLLGYPTPPRFVVSAMQERARVLGEEWTSRRLPGGLWSPESSYPIDTFEGLVSVLLAGPERLERLQGPVIFYDDYELLGYGTGDRWLARRYQGTPLTHISFTGVPIADYRELAHYFDPPLSAAAIEELTTERLAALHDMNVRDPRETARKAARLKVEQDPLRRMSLALSVALDHDASLRKDEALRFVEVALEAASGQPQLVSPQHERAVRKIVTNRAAVYGEITNRWIERYRERNEESPLLRAMLDEWNAFTTRQEQVAARYLFPRAP